MSQNVCCDEVWLHSVAAGCLRSINLNTVLQGAVKKVEVLMQTTKMLCVLAL